MKNAMGGWTKFTSYWGEARNRVAELLQNPGELRGILAPTGGE
jgi:hypothetical protein